MISFLVPRFNQFKISTQLKVGLGVLFCLFAQASFSQSEIKKSKSKRQYMDSDSYFKSARMTKLSTKVIKEEKPWGFGLYASTGTDLAKKAEERNYNQSLSFSGGYKISKTQSLGTQLGVSYYSVGNTIPKEEGNPAWDDLSLSWGQDLGEYNNGKFSHGVSTFAPTSYDSQFEGIKTGLSWGLTASHSFYVVKFSHSLNVSYTQHTFDYSPTTNKKNTPWSNSYNFRVGVPYKVNKNISLGASQSFSNRSAFDNDYYMGTSTLIYGGFSINEVNVSLNYLIGNYDENKTLRYFYVNEWEQKISVGVSYDI